LAYIGFGQIERCVGGDEVRRAAERRFALTQSLELYDVYQAKMLDCDPARPQALAFLKDLTIERVATRPSDISARSIWS
jgi:hypothetical protein